MKKLVLIAIALVTINATAQEHRKELRDREHQMENERGERGDRKEMFKDFTAEEIATLQTKKMTLHLDLTSVQQTKIQALNLEQVKLRKEKMEAREKMMETQDAKPSKEDRLKMMNEKLDHQIAAKQKLKSILTAEQFEKWELSQRKPNKRRAEQQKLRRHH